MLFIIYFIYEERQRQRNGEMRKRTDEKETERDTEREYQ